VEIAAMCKMQFYEISVCSDVYTFLGGNSWTTDQAWITNRGHHSFSEEQKLKPIIHLSNFDLPEVNIGVWNRVHSHTSGVTRWRFIVHFWRSTKLGNLNFCLLQHRKRNYIYSVYVHSNTCLNAYYVTGTLSDLENIFSNFFWILSIKHLWDKFVEYYFSGDIFKHLIQKR